jgi:hypothetical protein
MDDLSAKYFNGDYPSLTGGESQAATNSVSPIPPFSAPGSSSEATQSVIAGELGPVIPPVSERMRSAGVGSYDAPAVPDSPDWTHHADGSTYDSYPNREEPSFGRAPLSIWKQS